MWLTDWLTDQCHQVLEVAVCNLKTVQCIWSNSTLLTKSYLLFVFQCSNESIRVQSPPWAYFWFLQFPLESSRFSEMFRILGLQSNTKICAPKVRILVLRVSYLRPEVRCRDRPALMLQLRAGVLPGGSSAVWPGAAGGPEDTRGSAELWERPESSASPRDNLEAAAISAWTRNLRETCQSTRHTDITSV